MKIDDLFESRAKVFSGTSGQSRSFYSGQRRPPFVMVFVEQPDASYTAVVPTPAGKKLLAFKALYQVPDEYRQVWTDYIRYYAVGSDKADYSEQPSLFKMVQLDKGQLYRYLTLNHKLPTQAFTQFYGEVPEQIEGNIQVGQATLMLPDGSNKKTIDLATKLIKSLDHLLKPRGLQYLAGGKYKFINITTDAAGTYQDGTQIVTISIPLLRKGFDGSTYTIVHELGHKWEDTKNLSQVMKAKNSEIRKAGHSWKPQLNYQIQDGDILTYNGRTRKFKGDWRIDRQDDDMFLLYNLIDPDHVITAKKSSLRNAIWRIDDKVIQATSTDPWFPTEYSMSSYDEWFAELFVEYIMGRASDEVKAWFDSLPR